MKKFLLILPLIFALQIAQVSAKEIYVGSQWGDEWYVIDETYQKTGKGTWLTNNTFKIQIKLVSKSGNVSYHWLDYYTGQNSRGRAWFLSIDGGTARPDNSWTHPIPKIFDMYKGF